MTSDEIDLNICSRYIEHVQACFPEVIEESKRYIHVLKIRQWQLRRSVRNLHRVEDLETLRFGFYECERFFHDYLNENSSDATEKRVIEILQLVASELHAEIIEIEWQYPELRLQFAHDKEVLRLRWNAYVEDALETKAIGTE